MFKEYIYVIGITSRNTLREPEYASPVYDDKRNNSKRGWDKKKRNFGFKRGKRK